MAEVIAPPEGAGTGTAPTPADLSALENLQGATAPESKAPADPAGQQTFTVKVNGEDVAVTLDEALNGYMRQADYTQKTQEVARQREDLTYAERIAQALEDDPARAIQALQTAYGVEGASAVQAAVEPPKPTEPLSAEASFQQRVESFIAQQEMRSFEQQVTADLAAMHQQFGAFDDQAVIQYAVEHQIPDVKEAAKAFVVDRVISTANRKTADAAITAAKGSAPPVAGGHGVAAGATTSGSGKPVESIEEALALAMEAHPGVIV